MAYNYVTVSGTFPTLTGTVTFTPPEVTDPTGTIPVVGPGATSYTISGGSFTSAPLLATDNTGLLPAGWSYLATIALTGQQAYSYPVLVPASAGSAVTFSSLAVSASGGGAVADYAPAGLTGATAASRYVGATAGGPPVTGTFSTGDWVIDQTGCTWICTAAGSPGTWISPEGDPAGYGSNLNFYPPAGNSATAVAMNGGSVGIYTRFATFGYPMSKVYVTVGTQSGNICAAVYAYNASNPAAPGTQVATSGSVACPSGGGVIQGLALNGTITPGRGYWVGFAADNTTATFRQLGGVGLPGDSQWLTQGGTIFPLPSGIPATTSGSALRYPLLGSAV